MLLPNIKIPQKIANKKTAFIKTGIFSAIAACWGVILLWAPIADELKALDRKIVLNSMILKWDNIKDEFVKLIKI